jgi:hypothetical protein
MATKRKREDNSEVKSSDGLRKLLSSAITSDASAEVALPVHIMGEHCNFSPSLLQQILTGLFIFLDSRKLFDCIYSLENGLSVSFSNVQYQGIAPFVGLNPHRNMNDISTFGLYRSRIPTALFRSIVQDMDVLLHQYGPPIEHLTEETTSRFLAPVS